MQMIKLIRVSYKCVPEQSSISRMEMSYHLMVITLRDPLFQSTGNLFHEVKTAQIDFEEFSQNVFYWLKYSTHVYIFCILMERSVTEIRTKRYMIQHISYDALLHKVQIFGHISSAEHVPVICILYIIMKSAVQLIMG